eukprot:153777_1
MSLPMYCCKTVCCPLICCCSCVNHCCCEDCFWNAHCQLVNRFGKPDYNILMIGLSGGGKTTILNQLNKTHNFKTDLFSTKPTIGFNVETVERNRVNLTLWDVGGSKKILGVWRHYYKNAKCIIWVTDVSKIYNITVSDAKQCRVLIDGYVKMQINHYIPECIMDICVKYLYENNFNETRLLHYTMQNEELKDCPLLILANKSDCFDITNERIVRNLDLNTITAHKWNVVQCCATTGDGLDKGLDWITKTLHRSSTFGISYDKNNQTVRKLTSIFSDILCC